MGYRIEKEKVEKKKKLLKRILLGVLLLIIVGVCIFAACVPPNTWKYYVALPDVGKRGQGEMRIHFVDVGQGDATIIELPDGKTMLIDGGNGSGSATKSVLRYLNALRIDTLDYLVITHADSDHCGGIDTILKYKKARVAYLPPTRPEKDAQYAQAYAAVLKKGCERVYSSRELADLGRTETAYPYTLTFLLPYAETVDGVIEGTLTDVSDNECSSVIWLDYQGTSALFAADISSEQEQKLIRDDQLGFLANRGVELSSTEILKVGHHGSASSTSTAFLEYLGTKTASISCGETNAYGHPSKEVIARLDNADVSTYRTDLQGHTIVTISKNGAYKVKTLG